MISLLSKIEIRRYGIIFFVLIFIFASVFYCALPKYRAYHDPTATFLRGLDIGEIYIKGTDWLNPIYSPSRIGLSPNISYTYEYDFKKLENTEKNLKDVDRHKALKEIFQHVTSGARNQREKHLALLRFLQRVSLHGKLQPMYPDGQAVFDPIVLLELNEMRCGHVARLGIDLWDAGGGEGRIVHLGGHVSAEIYYDEGWHLLEGDIWENGVVIKDKDRNIPSIEALSLDPYKIDSLPPQYWSPINAQLTSVPYVSSFFFNVNAYPQNVSLQYLYKTATAEEERQSKWYGWNFYNIKTNTKIKLLEDVFRYQPSAVTISSISRKSNLFTIRWLASDDRDGDLLGYRVFISRNSRGWAYQQTKSPDEIRPYIVLGWKPAMYENVNKLPPSNVRIIETADIFATVKVPPDQERYITVMAFDSHGEGVDRQIYYPSDEVRISHSITRK